LLLFVALPLQGLTALITHSFPDDNGHGALAALVEAPGAQQDHGAGEHYGTDETASCCLAAAGFCYGTPALVARSWSALDAGLTSEPVLVALHAFSSSAPRLPERPPLAFL
jgi:hypothetical protein